MLQRMEIFGEHPSLGSCPRSWLCLVFNPIGDKTPGWDVRHCRDLIKGRIRNELERKLPGIPARKGW